MKPKPKKDSNKIKEDLTEEYRESILQLYNVVSDKMVDSFVLFVVTKDKDTGVCYTNLALGTDDILNTTEELATSLKNMIDKHSNDIDKSVRLKKDGKLH